MNDRAHELGHDEEHDDDNEEATTGERYAVEPPPELDAAPPPPLVPRLRRRTPTVSDPQFGGIPEGVTHWGLTRRTLSGGQEPLSWADPAGKVARREWPLSELSTDTIASRWGAGMYKIQWIRFAGGGRNVLRGGREIEILRDAPPVATAAESSSATPSVFDQMGDAMKLMRMIEERGDDQFMKIAKFAEVFGGVGRAPAGPSFEEIRSLLRDEREHAAKATAEAVRLAVEPLKAQIAELSEDDDDDDEPGGLAGVAAAGAKPLFRGRKWWQVAGNYLAENPQVIDKVAPVAVGAIHSVTSALAAAMAPPRRPVAVVVDEPAPRLHGEQPSALHVEPGPPAGVVDTRPPPPA